MILDRCSNRPLIIVERGSWYPYALNSFERNIYMRGLVGGILLRDSSDI